LGLGCQVGETTRFDQSPCIYPFCDIEQCKARAWLTRKNGMVAANYYMEFCCNTSFATNVSTSVLTGLRLISLEGHADTSHCPHPVILVSIRRLSRRTRAKLSSRIARSHWADVALIFQFNRRWIFRFCETILSSNSTILLWHVLSCAGQFKSMVAIEKLQEESDLPGCTVVW
jgi:hypothetical protein